MLRALSLRTMGVIFFILSVLIITPAYAGEKYSSGQPVITAGIEGSNELYIGEKTSLTVSIANSGLVDMKFVDAGTITPDYLPTTALTLTALLEKGESPVEVTADPQIIGNLPAGSVSQASFTVTVPESANAGSYHIPLTVRYQYMYTATQTGLDEIQYSFKDEEKTLSLPVTIRPVVRLGVISVESGDLNVGGEGHIIISVRNTGSDDGKETVFYLQPVGTNPVVPYQDSIYLGEFLRGDEANLSFKVSVASDADPSIQYPLKIQAMYTDYQGLPAETKAVDISAGFKPKVTFSVTSPADTVPSGGKGVIAVDYKNTGSDTVYNAQAGINIVDPFTSEDDQSYLGTVGPGDVVTAKFKLNVNSGATAKEYALDSEIRYTDINQTEYVTDPIKVPVDVADSSSDLLLLPGLLLIILVIGGGYIYYRRMQK